MRLAVITATPANVREGSGTHVAAEQLALRLKAEGHVVHLVRPEPSSLPTFTWRRFQFNRSLTVPSDVDLIVGFDMDGYRLAGHMPAPFIAYLHGIIADELRFDRGLDPWLRRLEARAERKSATRADLVLVTSEYSKRRATELYGVPAERIAISPPPIDLAGWQREVSTSTHSPRSTPTVLSVAHWYPRKNLESVIRAAQIVVRDVPKVEFHIVGEGPDVAWGKRLARVLGVGDIVQFLGHVKRSALAREHANAEVFCLPSRQEGFGLAVLQAMAVGLPVVALKAGATPELVTDGTNGLLTDDDPSALAQALVRLLTKKELRTRYSDAARLATQQWDAPKQIAIFLNHANRTLTAKRRA